MKRLSQKVLRFLKSDDGPTAVEYAMMMMLVFLVCLSIIVVMGQSTRGSFNDSSQSIDAAISHSDTATLTVD